MLGMELAIPAQSAATLILTLTTTTNSQENYSVKCSTTPRESTVWTTSPEVLADAERTFRSACCPTSSWSTKSTEEASPKESECPSTEPGSERPSQHTGN